MQVMAKFLGLMYTYLNISISKNIVPDEIKGREIHHSFPMTLFQVECFLQNLHCLSLSYQAGQLPVFFVEGKIINLYFLVVMVKVRTEEACHL